MNQPRDSLALPRIVSREQLYHGRKVSLERLTIVPPDGRQAVREVVRHPGAVVVLALTGDNQVVLEHNVRVSVGQVLLELPAGTLAPGESPATCAARELEEETGYRAGRIEPLAEFYTSPGVLDERMTAFVATGLTAGRVSLDPGEQLRVELVPYHEAMAMCLDGRIRDGKSIATLLLYEARRAGGTSPAGEGGQR